MPINEKEKSAQSLLEEVLVVDGKVHTDAVEAGLLFFDIYARWIEIQNSFANQEEKALFNIIVQGVLTGSAQRDAGFIQTLSNYTAEMIKKLDGQDLRAFSEFMMDISIGTVFTNDFIVENNKYLSACVMLDGLSAIKGTKSYHVIAGIGQLVGGVNMAMQLSLVGD